MSKEKMPMQQNIEKPAQPAQPQQELLEEIIKKRLKEKGIPAPTTEESRQEQLKEAGAALAYSKRKLSKSGGKSIMSLEALRLTKKIAEERLKELRKRK